jgi:hypothetical protein
MADSYGEIKDHFSKDPDVTVLSGRGAQGIKLGKKLIVMFLKGDLLVKLPEKRVLEIIASGEGEPYDPGTGKPMKNWVLIPETQRDLWIGYSEEAKQY